MKTIRRKVIFAKRNHVQQAVYEIYGTYNLCISIAKFEYRVV